VLKENQLLKEENASILVELEELKDKVLKETGNKSKSLCARDQETLKNALQAEVEAFERENAIRRQYQEEKAVWEADKSALTKQLDSASKELDKCSGLVEEVAVLKDAEMRAKKAEALLSKYKERCEEQNDIKSQIKILESTNKDLLARALEAEDKLTAVPKLQKQVESYRKSSTEAEVQAADLKQKVNAGQDMIRALQDQLEELQHVNKLQNIEGNNLKSEMLLQSELENELRSQGMDSNFGAGVSELNPAIQEQITTLTKENEALKRALDAETAEHVVEVENALADAQSLRRAFETKFLSCQQDLQRVEEELSVMKGENLRLREELDSTFKNTLVLDGALAKEVEARQLAVEESINLLNQLTQLQEKFTSLSDRSANEISTLQVSLHNVETESQSRIARLFNLLEQAESRTHHQIQKVVASSQKQAAMMTEAHDTKVQEMNKQYEELNAEFETFKISHSVSNDTHERNLKLAEDALNDFKNLHSVSNEQHEDEITKLKNELDLAADNLLCVRSEYEKLRELGEAKLLKLTSNISKGKIMLATRDEVIKQLQQEVASSNEALNSASAKILRLEKDLSRLKMEESKLRSTEDAKYRCSSEVSNEILLLKSEIVKLMEENKHLREISDQMGRDGVRVDKLGGGDSGGNGRLYVDTLRRTESELVKVKEELTTATLVKADAMNQKHNAEKRATVLSKEVDRLKVGLISCISCIQY
jgi:chromosome segregation ATPase